MKYKKNILRKINIIIIIINGLLCKYILNLIYACDAKLNLQPPLLQSSVSHDHSKSL